MSRQLEMWVKNMITNEEFVENYDKELLKGIEEQVKAFEIDATTWK